MADEKHEVTILWGQSPEAGDRGKTYTFDSKVELDAFMMGVTEMDGWAGYREVEAGYVVPEGGFTE